MPCTIRILISVWVLSGLAACDTPSQLEDSPDADTIARYCDRFEPNDDSSSATLADELISNGGLASVCPGTDVDFYRFDISGGEDVRLYISFDSPNSSRDLDLRLYNAAGELVTESATLDDFELIAHTAQLGNLLPAGTYTFEVVSREVATVNDYAFTVTIE